MKLFDFNKIVVILFCYFLCMACSGKYDSATLHGNWEVATWEKEATGNDIDGQMDMTFNSDGTYSVDYDGVIEKGEYWIYGEYLHTVETGQSEKKVRIVRLQNDTFEMQMNRSGSLERVVLFKN